MARVEKRKAPAQAQTPLEALMRDHLKYLEVRNYSEYTVRGRAGHIQFFVDWLKERSITEPVEVTRPVLERYQRHLFHYRKANGEPLSFRSQHARLVPLRVWFRWMTRQNHILHNPASEIELPRLGRALPKNIFSAAEVERIMMQPDIEEPIGLRDRALLEVLYSTGMRRLELVRLKLYDLSLDRGLLLINQGKGHKDRYVPIGERAVQWLQKCIRAGRLHRVPHGPGRTVQPRSSELHGQGAHRCGAAWQDRLLPLVPPHNGHADARERGRHTVHPADAWPRGLEDHANLYPGGHPNLAADPRRHAPGGDARRAPSVAPDGGASGLAGLSPGRRRGRQRAEQLRKKP